LFMISNTILGIILFVLLFVIVVKKIVKGVGGIDSGGIFLVVVTLGIIGMICSILVLLETYSINELITQISINKAKNVEIAGIDKFIARQELINNIFLIVGYTTLIFEFIIYKILKKKRKQEQAGANNHWKWNKFI
jgi:hypothetical protein